MWHKTGEVHFAEHFVNELIFGAGHCLNGLTHPFQPRQFAGMNFESAFLVRGAEQIHRGQGGGLAGRIVIGSGYDGLGDGDG